MFIDVRDSEEEAIDGIIFEDRESAYENSSTAATIEPVGGVSRSYPCDDNCGVFINGIISDDYFVAVKNIKHAKNLIKALDMAIELGWLK